MSSFFAGEIINNIEPPDHEKERQHIPPCRNRQRSARLALAAAPQQTYDAAPDDADRIGM